MNSYLKKYNITFVCLHGKKFGYGHYSRISFITKHIKKKYQIITIGDPVKKGKKRINNYKNLDEYIYKNEKKDIKNRLAFLDISHKSIVKSKSLRSFFRILKLQFEKIILLDSINRESIFQKIMPDINFLIIPYQLNKTTIDKYKKHVKLITFPNIFFCSKNLIKLRKKIKITNNFKKCLITLGSIDKERILIKLIKILKKDKFNNITFTVILGKFCAREYQRRIYKNIRGKKNFYIKKFQNDISNQIYNNDLIISSSGITKYEAYFLGKPNIRIYRNVDEKIMDKPFSELQLIKSFIYNDINLSFSKYFFKLYSEKSFMISKFRNNFKKIIKKKIENVNKFYV